MRWLAVLVALVCGAGAVAAATLPASAGGRVEVHESVTPLVDAFVPDDVAPGSPAVVFVHGGGWSKGSRHWWRGHALTLAARTGWPTFTVDYDLDADQPWRAQQADVRAALAWVRASAPTYGIDPHRVALVGSSAGGHLAMLVGATGGGAAAVASMAGVADLRALGDRSVAGRLAADMLGGGPDDVPGRWASLSPVTHVDAADPPMLLVASEDDPLVPASQSRRMASALRAAGGTADLTLLPGDEHVLGDAAMPLVEAWLRRTL